jgi:hypothetical protein
MAPSAEELAERRRQLLPVIGSMQPDEYMYALHRHGAYVACRRVDTVDLEVAKGAGL